MTKLHLKIARIPLPLKTTLDQTRRTSKRQKQISQRNKRQNQSPKNKWQSQLRHKIFLTLYNPLPPEAICLQLVILIASKIKTSLPPRTPQIKPHLNKTRKPNSQQKSQIPVTPLHPQQAITSPQFKTKNQFPSPSLKLVPNSLPNQKSPQKSPNNWVPLLPPPKLWTVMPNQKRPTKCPLKNRSKSQVV